ncbi:MAG: branched-chain amino acid ABC transporter permease [Chloroflexi bacterium]|nr:branched-chain amino acid ABC transporter permease [Chloroflexota bacterium]
MLPDHARSPSTLDVSSPIESASPSPDGPFPTDARSARAMSSLAAPIAWLVLLALLALLPLGLRDYGVQVVTFAFYFLILGVSWNLLAGYTGQFSLAQHAFATIGAYASAATALALGLPIVVGLLVGMVAAALLGLCLGWLTLGMRGVYFAIATWAFAESARILIKSNPDLTRGDMGLRVPFLFATPSPTPYYYVFLAAAALTVLLNVLLLRTKIGYRMRAIRDDQELAAAAGIDVTRWKRVIFTLSTALAGLAGGLYGHTVGLLTPSQADFSQMAFVIIAVVLGGFRTLPGPVVGALLAQGLSEWLRFSAELRMVIFALLVIVVMRVYPAGVVGLFEAARARLSRARVPKPPPAVESPDAG